MPRVGLTFDDGPGAWTEPILDVLAAHGARATFFVIGSAAAEHSDILRRMVTEGHEVGNHTWSHPRLARDCDDARVHDELERTNLLLTDLLGLPPRRFRAPRYDVDDRVLALAAELGLVHTHGDVTPPDWDPRCTVRYITTFVTSLARPNSIVGLHDGVPPKKAGEGRSQQGTVEAVEAIVPRLLERGLVCVTASEILGSDQRNDSALS